VELPGAFGPYEKNNNNNNGILEGLLSQSLHFWEKSIRCARRRQIDSVSGHLSVAGGH